MGGDRTRSNGFKLKEGRFILDIKKKFFAPRAARPWRRLSQGAVGAPSLAAPKAGLDGAGGSLVRWEGSCARQGAGIKLGSQVPSNANRSVIPR